MLTFSQIKHMELRLSLVFQNCTLIFQDLSDLLSSAHTVCVISMSNYGLLISTHGLIHGDCHIIKVDKYEENVIQRTIIVTC